MARGSAKVEDIEALKRFRVALVKFAESANVALADAESEMRRVFGWVERDQASYWQSQIRKRQELLGRAEEALRMKTIYKQADGSTPSGFHEQKAVLKAKRLLQEAEEKLANCKRWARRLEKEMQLYKGATSRLMTDLAGDVPVALAKLDNMAGILEQYVGLKPLGAEGAGDAAASPGAGPSMGRAATPVPAGGAAIPPFPRLVEPQVALLHCEHATGILLLPNGQYVQGDGDPYVIFDTMQAAQRYAADKVAASPEVECVIYDHAGRGLLTISVDGVS